MVLKNRKVLYRLGLAFGIGLFLYQIVTSYKAFAQLLVSQDVLIGFFLSCLLATTAHSLPTLIWGILMRSIGTYLPWREIIRGYPLSFLPRYIPGSIWGYLSRSEWLRNRAEMHYIISTYLSIIEMWVVFSSIGVVLFFSFWQAASGFWWLWLIPLSLLGIFISWWAFRYLIRIPPIRERLLAASQADDFPSPHFAYYLLAVLMYVVMWILYGIVLSAILSLLTDRDMSLLPGASAYFAISWLVGFLALIIPSGIGVREMVLASLLTASPTYSTVNMAAVAVIMRFLLVSGEFLWIGLSQAISRFMQQFDKKLLKGPTKLHH